MTPHGIYTGWVGHVRLKPVRHRFRYRVYSLMLDLDDLASAGGRLLRIDRPGLMSFYQKDHGKGDADLAAWARAQFTDYDACRIRLFCFPRVLGYQFNPLALYFAYDAADRLEAVLYQVTNTFGDRHSYLIDARAGKTVRQKVGKLLHVSPFNPTGGAYRFRLHDPDDKFALTIVQEDRNGAPTLVATQTARHQPLSDQVLLKHFFSHPLLTWKVITAIHFQALRLFAKGMGYNRRPKAPERHISRGDILAQTPK